MQSSNNTTTNYDLSAVASNWIDLWFNECAWSESRKLQQRMFFLRKWNHFRVSCVRDQTKLQRKIKTANKIIGVDQVSGSSDL